MAIHASPDKGETSVCGKNKAEGGFDFVTPGELEVDEGGGEPCGRCLAKLRDNRKVFKGADPSALQSAIIRLTDASGRNFMEIAVNTRDWELEAASVNRYDQERKTDVIEFTLRAVKRTA